VTFPQCFPRERKALFLKYLEKCSRFSTNFSSVFLFSRPQSERENIFLMNRTFHEKWIKWNLWDLNSLKNFSKLYKITEFSSKTFPLFSYISFTNRSIITFDLKGIFDFAGLLGKEFSSKKFSENLRIFIFSKKNNLSRFLAFEISLKILTN